MRVVNLLVVSVSMLGGSCLSDRDANPSGTATAGPPANLVLESYEVPNEAAAQVRAVLKDVMWFGAGSNDKGLAVGRAEVGPDGRLVVLASRRVQEGVAELITELGKTTKVRPTIELSYWMVQASPGKEAARSPALQELGPALAEIEKADGPQRFTLQEKLKVSTLTGEFSKVQGRDWEVGQTAVAAAGGVSAELRIQTRGPQRLETRVKLAPGQIAVLASSGADDQGEEEPGSIYYLIRADVRDGGAGVK